jgi:S1-C subfamily serine protease
VTPELAQAMKLASTAGALVNAVDADGPGARANLRPGDVVVSMAGQPLHDGRDLIRGVLAHEPGQTVTLEIIRDGRHYGTNLTLAPRHEEPIPQVPVQMQRVAHPGLGMSVREISAAQAERVGIQMHGSHATIIGEIVAGSAADRTGLKPGDVIVEADGKLDPSATDVQRAAQDGEVVLRVQRGARSFYAALRR